MIIKTLKTGERLSLKQSKFQFFADEPGQGEGSTGNEGNTGTGEGTGEGDNPQGDDPKEKKDPTDLDDPDKDKKTVTFTQAEMSKVAATEAKKERLKILKELGIEDVSKGKEALKAYKKQIDDQKTDAEKAKDRAEALEKSSTDLQKEKEELKTQLAALRAGVDPEKLEDATFLASKYVSDDVTVDEAIEQVLEKYPQFKANAANDTDDKEGKKKKPKLGSDDYKTDQKATDSEKWANAFKFN